MPGHAPTDHGADQFGYLDCTDKANGNYSRPTDCTRFIAYSNGEAYEMQCGTCDTNNPDCMGEEHLSFVQEGEHGYCEWPRYANCYTSWPAETVMPAARRDRARNPRIAAELTPSIDRRTRLYW